MTNKLLVVDSIINFVRESNNDLAKLKLDKLIDCGDKDAIKIILDALINDCFWKLSLENTNKILDIAKHAIVSIKFTVDLRGIESVIDFLLSHRFDNDKWAYSVLELLRILIKVHTKSDNVLFQKVLSVGDPFLSSSISSRFFSKFGWEDCDMFVYIDDDSRPCRSPTGKYYSTKWSFYFQWKRKILSVKQFEIPQFYATSESLRGNKKFDKCFVVPVALFPWLKEHSSVNSYFTICFTCKNNSNSKPLDNVIRGADNITNFSTGNIDEIAQSKIGIICPAGGDLIDNSVIEDIYVDIEHFNDDLDCNRWSGTQLIPVSIHTNYGKSFGCKRSKGINASVRLARKLLLVNKWSLSTIRKAFRATR